MVAKLSVSTYLSRWAKNLDNRVAFKKETRRLNTSKFSVIQSKKEGKDQESIQSSTTADLGYQWESNKLNIRIHKREPKFTGFTVNGMQ